MNRKITRIAPWQAGKLSAVIYFAFGLMISLPITVVGLMVSPNPEEPKTGHWIVIIGLPFFYALACIIFVPLGCWIYNISAKLVGGLSIDMEDDSPTRTEGPNR